MTVFVYSTSSCSSVAFRHVFGPWPPRSLSHKLLSPLLPPSSSVVQLVRCMPPDSTLPSTSRLSHRPSSSETTSHYCFCPYENHPSLLPGQRTVLYLEFNLNFIFLLWVCTIGCHIWCSPIEVAVCSGGVYSAKQEMWKWSHTTWQYLQNSSQSERK
jgi:hypothetical protein